MNKNFTFQILGKGLVTVFTFAVVSTFFFSFTTTKVADETTPQALIKAMEKAMGSWNKMYKLKDVQFTYNYEYPGQNKKDLSIEKYIFEGEHSWAKYMTHQINVMPEQDGEVIQSLIGDQITVSHMGKIMDDPKSKGLGTFLRKANYYWFTMMYKLSDPGVKLSMNGTETMNGTIYQKVRVDFNPDQVGKKENDTYVLYINSKTKLVDQFFFSLPAQGVNEPVILMKVAYQTINGVKVPYKRSIFQPNAEGQYGSTPNLIQTSTDIKFKNGFKPSDFMIK